MLKILDRSYKSVGLLRRNGDRSKVVLYFDDEYVQDLTTGAETFKFSVAGDNKFAKYLKVGNYITFRDDKDIDRLFVIMEVTDSHEGTFIKEVYCEMAGIELNNEVVRPQQILSATASSFLTTILTETSWEVGEIDEELFPVHDFQITEYTSVYGAIQQYILQTYECEIGYRVVYEKNQIAHKYIDLYSQRGKKLKNVFTYSKNMASVVRKVDSTDLATALIGVGKNNITFKDVEATDKPLGQDFIMNEQAYARWNVNGSNIMGVYKYDTDSQQELLKKTRIELLKRSNPQITYELQVVLLQSENAEQNIELGDTVGVVDHGFNPPLSLTARVTKLTTSKTNPSANTCELANFKTYVSKINNSKILNDILDIIKSLKLGKLSPTDILVIKNLLEKLGYDKETIDKLFRGIIDKPDIPDIPDIPDKPDIPDIPDNPDIPDVPDNSNNPINEYIPTLTGGLWLGDSRMEDMKKYGFFKADNSNTNVTNYKKALDLYKSLGMGKYTSSKNYTSTVSSSNKYKIPTLVKYWSAKFGLDEKLVYAVMVAESGGDPYNATKDPTGAYGLMQCERGAYFSNYRGTSAQKMKFIDGTTKSFYPSYNNMTPYKNGSTTINGVSVDKNISNQVMFGCHELRYAIDYAKQNIFAGLIAYNMGIGAMCWIVSKYVCDTYGYSFVNKNSISAQSKKAQTKIYEVLENGGFEFANWRKKYKENGGAGTVNNVEGYLAYYKSVNNQLPYVYDSIGNKFGYGVTTTNLKALDSDSEYIADPVSYLVDNTTLTETRNTIVAKAKEIVKLHADKKASYSQFPRTVDDTKRQYIKKGSYVKMNSRKWGYAGSTYYGISTSANGGKGVIGYDCSSFASCCYMAAGLKSLYAKSCSEGTIMSEITKNGGMMWLNNAEGRKKAIPGDCIMFCSNKHVPTQKEMNNKKLLDTHHIGVYIGDDKMAHASKWADWSENPESIKISKLSTYKTASTTFFIRPKDLQETDKKFTPPVENLSNQITAKCVLGASPYHFYSNNKLLKTVHVGKYSDTTPYPTDPKYIYVHLGVNDPDSSGYASMKTLLNLLRDKYPKVPIFVAKELHFGRADSNYETYNKMIDIYNEEILEYCKTHLRVYQIDITEGLEENGVLKASLSNDGVHFKSKTEYQLLFNNIKRKIINTKKPNQGSGQDPVDPNAPATKKEGIVVNKTLQAAQTYQWGRVRDLTFRLPSKVEENFYARLIFTTTDEMKYSQSKICYLDGDDCKNGQFIPKPNSSYKIIIMKNAYTDLTKQKYYGSVNKEKVGSTTTVEKDFKGGKKVVEIAKTYLNHPELEYVKSKSTVVDNTPASFENPAANLSHWYDKARNKYQIDCSTLAKYVYMGITYDKSPFKNNKMTKVKRNSAYSWAFTFPRNAAEQARYCVEHGWVLHDADLVNYFNLKEGDIIFYDRDKKTTSRYMQVSHVAICVGVVNDEMSCIESTNCDNGVRIKSLYQNTPDKVLFIARPKKG